jgi:hypothetical protein
MAFTPFGFPHSDTSGSTLVWQLTGLFRGLHRPSSPACPKASISCPESLIIELIISKLMLSRSLVLQEHPLQTCVFRWCSTFPKKDSCLHKISLSDSSPILGSLKISLQDSQSLGECFFFFLKMIELSSVIRLYGVCDLCLRLSRVQTLTTLSLYALLNWYSFMITQA